MQVRDGERQVGFTGERRAVAMPLEPHRLRAARAHPEVHIGRAFHGQAGRRVGDDRCDARRAANLQSPTHQRTDVARLQIGDEECPFAVRVQSVEGTQQRRTRIGVERKVRVHLASIRLP